MATRLMTRRGPFAMEPALRDCQKFVVLGACRAGAAMVQHTLARHSQAACLGPVLHTTDRERRRFAHQAYFGPEDEDWCYLHPSEISRDETLTPQYITPGPYVAHKLWWAADVEARREEGQKAKPAKAFGFLLLEEHANELDLWETLNDFRDLRIVRIVRNPLVCFISRRQAEASGTWELPAGQPVPTPRQALIHSDELAEEMQQAEVRSRRVEYQLRELGLKVLTLRYRDLVRDYDWATDTLQSFLGLPREPLELRTEKLNPQPVWDRVAEFTRLRLFCPQDLQHHFVQDLV